MFAKRADIVNQHTLFGKMPMVWTIALIVARCSPSQRRVYQCLGCVFVEWRGGLTTTPPYEIKYVTTFSIQMSNILFDKVIANVI